LGSKLDAHNKKIIIVISNFYPSISDNLLNGAQGAYVHHGGVVSDLQIFSVPGAFEIPGTIKQIITHIDSDAILGLGVIIKGETSHFDYVATESARGIASLSRQSAIPVINGILTTDNKQQAKERSLKTGNNKGWETMESALKTILVYKDIHTAK